jgi:hypothetical protein
MRTRQSTRTTEGIKDGSIEDIQFSYGIRAKEDPLELERQAGLQEQRFTRHKWLGRILMATSGRNPVRQEQRMQNDIKAARQAAQPPVEPQPVYHYNFETGELTRNPLAEQPQGSAHQQPEQQLIPGAPAEAADHYVGHHRA